MQTTTHQKEVPYRGFDSKPENRPGVPREAAPHRLEGAHWDVPPQQIAEEPPLFRVGLEGPTPVFSTALPPRGASGLLRRIAYQIPDHQLGHWVLLMVADRVDVLEHLLPSPVRAALSGLHGARSR